MKRKPSGSGAIFLAACMLVSSLSVGSIARAGTTQECPGVTDQSSLRVVSPTPDTAGRVFPLVVIHGITGAAKAFNQTISKSMVGAFPKPERSLLDALSGKPGQSVYPGLPHTRVYSFEYTEDSLRWFTEAADGRSPVGFRFASVIDCLYALHGVPVMVLAHSMGGLVTRWAANQSPGLDGQSKIGKVVTLGTPYLGSYLSSALGGGVVDGLASISPVIRALVWWCGHQGTKTGNSTAVDCLGLSSLTSEAGRALRLGSSELSTLAPWPEQVDVTALAGSIVIEESLFGARIGESEIGDVVVGLDSATHNRDEQFVEQCRLGSDESPLWQRFLKSITGIEIAQRSAELAKFIFSTPCYHGGLMESVTLTNEVLGEFNDWILNAQVPVEVEIPSGMDGTWSGQVTSSLVETQLVISVADGTINGRSGRSCEYTLKPILISGDLLTLSAIREPGCVQGGKWFLSLLPDGTMSYRWKDPLSAREDTGILSRSSGVAPSSWPTNGGDVQGPPVLYVFLGSQLLLDDWVSCTDDQAFCIVGVGEEILVYRTSGIQQVATLTIGGSDPQTRLSNLGFTKEQIVQLLS